MDLLSIKKDAKKVATCRLAWIEIETHIKAKKYCTKHNLFLNKFISAVVDDYISSHPNGPK